jgi:hypothetical protein
VSVAIGLLLVAVRALTGRPLCAEGGLAPAEGLATGFVTAALIGYTMAAGRYLNASILGDIYESAGQSREVVAQLDDMAVFSTALPVLRRSRVAGMVGASIALVVLETTGEPLLGRVGVFADPELFEWLVLVPLLFFLLARAAFNTAMGTGELNRSTIHPRSLGVDLLDLRPVYAQGRIGLRMALVWVVGSTISSLYVFEPRVASSVLSFLVAGAAVAIFALLFPARRLHRAIRAAKLREMDRLRDELRRVRDEVVQHQVDQSGRLADLLGYWSYLENLREWPFDNPTLTRFLLYLLIPLGSWLGGALVERLVSILLD